MSAPERHDDQPMDPFAWPQAGDRRGRHPAHWPGLEETPDQSDPLVDQGVMVWEPGDLIVMHGVTRLESSGDA